MYYKFDKTRPSVHFNGHWALYWRHMTVTIQIGNSDNKLTQAEWANFVTSVRRVVGTYAETTHFYAPSPGDSQWQNAAWVIECHKNMKSYLVRELKRIRAVYSQDSVAWTEGKTKFI